MEQPVPILIDGVPPEEEPDLGLDELPPLTGAGPVRVLQIVARPPHDFPAESQLRKLRGKSDEPVSGRDDAATHRSPSHQPARPGPRPEPARARSAADDGPPPSPRAHRTPTGSRSACAPTAATRTAQPPSPRSTPRPSP